MKINDQITRKPVSDSNSFVAIWQESQNLKGQIPPQYLHPIGDNAACSAVGESSSFLSRKSVFSIRHLVRQKGIRRDCIREALIKRINSTAESAGRKVCESDSSSPQKIQGPPCITEAYVDYVHWTANAALQCIGGAAEGGPIDANIIYGKLNLESAFGYFVTNGSGIGLGALTSDAAGEMGRETGGLGYLKQLASLNPACGVFENVLKHGLEFDGKGNVRLCQLVGTENGVARNVLLGLGLFAFYRDTPEGSVSHLIGRTPLARNPEVAKMRDYLTLIAYNKGLGGASEIIKKVLRHAQVNPKMSFIEFRKIVDNYSNYTSGIHEKLNEVFKGENQPVVIPDCSEETP
jgi:hypothetical protein